MTTDPSPSTSPVRRDAPFYAIAAVAGMATGWIDVVVNDLLFTALLVLIASMALAMLRPRWPWRWVIAVVLFIPLSEFVAFLMMNVKPTRGQVYGSFLAFLPGIAGAYGGSVVRTVIDNLRKGQ